MPIFGTPTQIQAVDSRLNLLERNHDRNKARKHKDNIAYQIVKHRATETHALLQAPAQPLSLPHPAIPLPLRENGLARKQKTTNNE